MATPSTCRYKHYRCEISQIKKSQQRGKGDELSWFGDELVATLLREVKGRGEREGKRKRRRRKSEQHSDVDLGATIHSK